MWNHRLELRYYVRGSMDIDYIEGYIDQTEAYLMSRADELEIESLFSSYNLDRGRTTIVLTMIANGLQRWSSA